MTTPPPAVKPDRPRVLVLTPYFLPSQQGGGSVRALHHLAQHLGDRYELVIAAGCRDVRSRRDFEPVEQQAARQASGLDIRYLSYGFSLVPELIGLLRQDWDLIYLNSFLSLRFSLLPLLLKRSRHRLLLAPRGELLPGALSVRSRRKRLYLALLRSLGLLKSVHWHATSNDEATQLRVLGLGPALQAPDLPPRLQADAQPPLSAASGPLRAVFLSRIDRVKNLGFLLDVLRQVREPVQLDIYGPIADPGYWQQCQAQMRRLPAHVRATYHGALAPAEVPDVLRRHELFVLPTLGENNGYAISEARQAGCLLLISDRTPWTAAQRQYLLHALPLEQPQAFATAIDALARLDTEARCALRRQAQQLARELLQADEGLAATQRVFDALCGTG